MKGTETMDVTNELWTVTVTYRDGTAKVIHVKDLDEFHIRIVHIIHNNDDSPTYSILIH